MLADSFVRLGAYWDLPVARNLFGLHFFMLSRRRPRFGFEL
jgi:hypothetical protein